LTLGKIIKIVATRRQVLRLKCTKFNFGWGSALDPAEGAYSATPDPLATSRRPTSKGRGGKRERRGRGADVGDETTPFHAPYSVFLDTPILEH